LKDSKLPLVGITKGYVACKDREGNTFNLKIYEFEKKKRLGGWC